MIDFEFWEQEYLKYIKRLPQVSGYNYKSMPEWHRWDCASFMKNFVLEGLKDGAWEVKPNSRSKNT